MGNIETLFALSRFRPVDDTSSKSTDVVLYRVCEEGKVFLRAKKRSNLSLYQKARLFFKTQEFRLETIYDVANKAMQDISLEKGSWFRNARENIENSFKFIESKYKLEKVKSFKEFAKELFFSAGRVVQVAKNFFLPSIVKPVEKLVTPVEQVGVELANQVVKEEAVKLQTIDPADLRGIKNQGNWCYFDALLKGMCASTKFRETLNRRLKEEIPQKKAELDVQISQLRVFAEDPEIKTIEAMIAEIQTRKNALIKGRDEARKNFRIELEKIDPLLKGVDACYVARDRTKNKVLRERLEELKKNPEVIRLEEAIWELNNNYFQEKSVIDRELENAQKRLGSKSELCKGFSSCEEGILHREGLKTDIEIGLKYGEALESIFSKITDTSKKKTPLEGSDLDEFVNSLKGNSYFYGVMKGHRQQDSLELMTVIFGKLWEKGFLSVQEKTYRSQAEDDKCVSSQETSCSEKAIFVPSIEELSINAIDPIGPNAVPKDVSVLLAQIPERCDFFSLEEIFQGVLDSYEVNKNKEELVNQEENQRFFGGKEGLQRKRAFLEKKHEDIPIVRSLLLNPPAPESLPIVLPRFINGNKRNIVVDVPFVLEVPLEGEKPVSYVLRSAVIHSGSTTSGGHYYTYTPDLKSVDAVTGLPTHWICQNDSSVYPESFDVALSKIASDGYILFYDKIEKKSERE